MIYDIIDIVCNEIFYMGGVCSMQPLFGRFTPSIGHLTPMQFNMATRLGLNP
jgi:hypothetical protein